MSLYYYVSPIYLSIFSVAPHNTKYIESLMSLYVFFTWFPGGKIIINIIFIICTIWSTVSINIMAITMIKTNKFRIFITITIISITIITTILLVIVVTIIIVSFYKILFIFFIFILGIFNSLSLLISYLLILKIPKNDHSYQRFFSWSMLTHTLLKALHFS